MSIPEITSILQGAGVDGTKIRHILRGIKNDKFHSVGPGYLYWHAGEMGIDLSNPDYKPAQPTKQTITMPPKKASIVKKEEKNTTNVKKEEEVDILSAMETIEKYFGLKMNECDNSIYNRDGTPIDDLNSIYVWLSEQGSKVMHHEKVKFLSSKDCYLFAKENAKRKSFNPVKDQLKAFKQKHKDGYVKMDVDKLATQWINPDATDYENAVFKAWCISAMKRLMHPGCQAHLVLVLNGPQDAGKSSFIRTLGGVLFKEEINFDKDPDMIRARRKGWILECGEMNHTKKEANAIKASITATHDVYRPLYAERIGEYPRHYVFAGTTNDPTFLSDPTGNRRYGIIKVKKIYNEQKLLLNQQFLDFWANIYQAVLDGASAELSDDMKETQKENNKEYNAEDPFVEMIQNYMGNHPERDNYTPLFLWQNAMEGHKSQFKYGERLRIVNILKDMGWVQKNKRVSGKQVKVYVKN